MKQTNFTPQTIYDQMKKTIIGQDEYLKALSNAAWLHHLRYQHFIDTAHFLDNPKQNLLVIGESGSGKTLAVQTLGKLLNLPVIIEDASSLTGEGWRGKSVSHICERIHHATDRAEDKLFSIVCFDEIDKVFRSNRSNTSGISDSGFLPLNNLLTFLAGGMITCTDNNSQCTINSSDFLVICLGAFEGLDEIVQKRLTGDRRIGFCGEGHDEPDEDDILQYVTEEDLHEYGIPWEFLGRLNLITRTRPLNVSDYKRILTQSDASPISQFNDLLSKTSNIRVSITDAAVEHIADKAGKSKEGARMLSRIITETLQPAIFGIGQDPNIDGIEIDCSNNELFTRSEYDVYPDWQAPYGDDSDAITDADYLSRVPLPCNSNRGEILLFAEKIKKSSRLSWMLPETYVSAATCVVAAAICSQLLYAGGEDKNLLTLYNQVDLLPDKYIQHTSSSVDQMINEFLQKAQTYGSLEKAKTNAKQFLIDYCKNYSVYEPQFSA